MRVVPSSVQNGIVWIGICRWRMDDRAERALRIYGPSGLIRLSVAGAVTSHFPTRNT